MSILRGEVTVRGEKYEVSYNPEWGDEFSTTVEGKSVRAKTWEALKAAINTELRRRTVPFEVTFINPNTGKTGTVKTIHATLKKPVIVWSDNSRETRDVESPLRPDTDVKELRRLRVEYRTAEKALAEFRHRHRLNSHLSSECEDERGRQVAKALAAEEAAAIAAGPVVDLDA